MLQLVPLLLLGSLLGLKRQVFQRRLFSVSSPTLSECLTVSAHGEPWPGGWHLLQGSGCRGQEGTEGPGLAAGEKLRPSCPAFSAEPWQIVLAPVIWGGGRDRSLCSPGETSLHVVVTARLSYRTWHPVVNRCALTAGTKLLCPLFVFLFMIVPTSSYFNR